MTLVCSAASAQYFLTDKRTATAFDNLLLLINLINAVNYQIDMIDKLWLYDMQAIRCARCCESFDEDMIFKCVKSLRAPSSSISQRTVLPVPRPSTMPSFT